MMSDDGGRRRRANPRRARTPDSQSRGAILAATERLLADRPLHMFSVTDIADEAGTSRGIVYFHFASKSAILAALAEGVCAQLIAIWRDADRPQDLSERCLQAGVGATVELWTRNRTILCGVVECFRVDPEVSEIWSRTMNMMTDVIRDRIEHARATPDWLPAGAPNAQILAETLVWSTERLNYIAAVGPATALGDPRTLIDALMRLWSGLLADTPADTPVIRDGSPAAVG